MPKSIIQLTVNGRTMSLPDWAEHLGTDLSTLRNTIEHGLPIDTGGGLELSSDAKGPAREHRARSAPNRDFESEIEPCP
jgi:hypothetical protein